MIKTPGNLNAATLAASARMDLCLDYNRETAKPSGQSTGIIGASGNITFRHRNVMIPK
jgi:hypothetical protein